MTKVKEIKFKGFVTYNDGQSIYEINGKPRWKKRIWNIFLHGPPEWLEEDCYLSKVLEEFGVHTDVEVIVRRIDEE